MAVEILIEDKRSGTAELIPVATAKVFRDFWLAGSRELILRTVPLMGDGLFGRDDLPELLAELKLLRQWFKDTQTPDDYKSLELRINRLMGACERALKDPQLDIS